MNRYRIPLIAALIVFLILMSLTFVISNYEQKRYGQVLRSLSIDQLSKIRANLETGINANFYITRGLIAFVSSHPGIDQDTFHKIADNILRYQNHIRNIGLAPNNILTFVHPLKENEKAIGLNYEKNAQQWPAVKRAIEERKTVVAGPVKLVQGGKGFICRTPIYLIGNDGEFTDYWGLASIVIDQRTLFQAAGFYRDDHDIKIAVRGVDGLGEKGAVFDGREAIFQEDPVLLDVVLPDGNWQLAAVPKEGWNTASPNIGRISLIGIALSALSAIIVLLWVNKLIQTQYDLEAARKKAESATKSLKENERFLNVIVENIPNMIFVKDAAELRFVIFNKASEDLTGYAREDLIGKNDYDFFPRKQADFFNETDRDVLRTRRFLDIPEEEIETRNHGTRLLHTKKLPICDEEGTPLFLLGISEDITERKKAENQIRKDSLRTQILLDLHKQAPTLQGSDFLEYALEEAVRFTESSVGYIHEVEEIDGIPTVITAHWNRKTLDECTAARDSHYPLAEAGIWADTIRLRKPVIHNDYQNIQGRRGYPDGHFHLIRHLGVPVVVGNKVKLILGVGNKESDYTENDVSLIQIIANEIQSLVAQQRFALKQEQLSQQLKQAQKMEAIGLMAGGVAHDLNNILSGLVGYPELILLKLPQESPLRKFVEDIKESGKRAALVVSDLLTVARGAASERELCSLNTLVQEYLNSEDTNKIRTLYPNISIESKTAAVHPNILCSPVHLKKCIMNLVNNGAEAITDSGLIDITTQNMEIDPTSDKEYKLDAGQYTILSVRDSGKGISSEELEHIFEPFYTKKELGRSGTGLGLTVVWNTMEEHGGRVFVDSNDSGTCFRLFFPTVDGEALPDNEEETVPLSTDRQEKILVVDDEPLLRDLATQMLTSLGYDVDSVESGESAIQYLKEKPADVIILDMLMDPGMNGFETYSEIVRIIPKQKAVIASGFSESDDVKAAIKLGACAFIKKPYMMNELGKAVKKALSENL